MAQVSIERVEWKGWPNCYRLTNGEVELILTSDVGPRILFFGFCGGMNVFWVQEEAAGKSGEKNWIPRGGHRIWVAPEDVRYTYPPDNSPVQVERAGNTLIATQAVEAETGIEKQISVTLDTQGSAVEVRHRLTNRFAMPLEFAPWALSMMAPGGIGITGFPPRGTHPEMLAPTNPLVMWAFTDLSDPRWKFTRKYLLLRQDPTNRTPQKLGHFNPKTWGAYLLGSDLFVLRYDADLSRPYPDFGCSFETFTNERFLELETLGPLQKIPSGGWMEHVERWRLYRSVSLSRLDDEELDRVISPLTAF